MSRLCVPVRSCPTGVIMKNLFSNRGNVATQKFSGCTFHIQEPGFPKHDFHVAQKLRKEFVVGRLTSQSTFDTVQIQLRDPYVSRIHCRFFWVSYHGWMLEDLGSSNGTWIVQENSRTSAEQAWRRVHKPVRLVAGSSIMMGGCTLQTSLIPARQAMAWVPRKIPVLNHL